MYFNIKLTKMQVKKADNCIIFLSLLIKKHIIFLYKTHKKTEQKHIFRSVDFLFFRQPFFAFQAQQEQYTADEQFDAHGKPIAL